MKEPMRRPEFDPLKGDCFVLAPSQSAAVKFARTRATERGVRQEVRVPPADLKPNHRKTWSTNRYAYWLIQDVR